jgi:site-specific recombinase XerD
MFLEYCSDMFLEQVTVKEVRGYVRRPDLSPRGRNGRRRVIYTFFNWCRERSYCVHNPVVSVSPSRTDQTVPHILSLKEVHRLLKAAAEVSSGSLLPFFVLSLFAGLRPKEAAGLSWQAIDLVTGNIHLDGKHAKLRQRRVISISDNLNSWLRSCINKPI